MEFVIMTRPGVLKFYKGKGAAAFSIIPPRWDDKGYMEKHGAVLLEACPAIGKEQWDWDQKIKFAISVQDICNLIDSDPKKRRIFHMSGETPKTVEFIPGSGQWEGTYQMQVSEGQGDGRKAFMVPFSNGEYTLLVRLLLSVCPMLLGWSEDAVQSANTRR
jgi:hypothetical protein